MEELIESQEFWDYVEVIARAAQLRVTLEAQKEKLAEWEKEIRDGNS